MGVGFMVSVVESGTNGLVPSPGLSHCVVILGRALISHSAESFQLMMIGKWEAR